MNHLQQIKKWIRFEKSKTHKHIAAQPVFDSRYCLFLFIFYFLFFKQLIFVILFLILILFQK